MGRKRKTAILLLAVLLMLSGCVKRAVEAAVPTQTATAAPTPAATEAPTPSAVPASTSTATPAPTFTPEPTATPEPTPRPTPVPTPTPVGAKAKRHGKRIVPADWGVTIPLRSVPADDSFFSSTCMIGNSLVEGFQLWSGLHNIRCMAETGATVYSVVKEMDLRPLRNERYSDVYLVLGLNEMGMPVESYIENYEEVVDYARQYQPDANIIVVSVTPVMRFVEEQSIYYTMANINAYNDALREMCARKECWYLDISSVLIDEDGYLSAFYGYSGDGKHFEPTGYMLWANYMRTHYVSDSLPAE